jgi:hypothetical protein
MVAVERLLLAEAEERLLLQAQEVPHLFRAAHLAVRDPLQPEARQLQLEVVPHRVEAVVLRP